MNPSFSFTRTALAAALVSCTALAGASEESPPAGEPAASAAPEAPALQPRQRATLKAGMVCTRMGKPSLPPISWRGRAAYQTQAAVKNGRVVSVTFTNLLDGVPREVDRALKNSIVTAMQGSYECPGDHVFDQQFAFKFGD